MAVQGPIGFRSLKWDEKQQVFTSPVKTQFTWSKKNFEQVTECYENINHVLVPVDIDPDLQVALFEDTNDLSQNSGFHLSAEFWDTTQEIPAIGCKCGLFCTLDWKEPLNYAGQNEGVILLCEGGGRIVLHEMGFRARELTYLAVIKRTGLVATDNMALHETMQYLEMIASDYFSIPAIGFDVAINATRIQWELFGMTYPAELELQYKNEFSKELIGAKV